jgi:hypothetical protein
VADTPAYRTERLGIEQCDVSCRSPGLLWLAEQVKDSDMIGVVRASILVGIAFASTTHSQPPDTHLPRFEDYPVARYTGRVVAPKFRDQRQYSGTDSRCLASDYKDYSAERVNFAGHLVIAQCGCGTGCFYLFMWDARTGRLNHPLPFGPFNVGPYFDNLHRDAAPISYSGASFQSGSKLLVIEGCREGTCECGTWYYAWNENAFRLLRKVSTPAENSP